MQNGLGVARLHDEQFPCIRVVLCASVPSLIVIGINNFYCLRLFVVVYKLVIVVLP